MKKTRVRDTTTDAEIDAIIQRANLYEPYRPQAVSAKYRSGSDVFEIKFKSGISLIIPRQLLQGVGAVTAAEAGKVRVINFGSMLDWPNLDVQHYVPGLLEGVFGTRRWMSEIGRKGGLARSKAKAKSSRLNGRKGGRPKKNNKRAA